MCTGIALPVSELPAGLLDAPDVACRVYDREGRREVQFHWWQAPTVLPVRWDGRFRLLPWGSKQRRGTPLPVGGWVAEDDVRAGAFAGSAPEPVVIPAVLGQHAGTWFLITEGVRGVVVRGAAGPVVYMLTTRATNYNRNMTEQQPVMPVLVNQVF